ncbi:unnamed protein product [Dibothriocephalus latus]|uniref:Fibronectin type-III domain-containing protein n=1 Tax=Dibothriocephalus latus TaxID=60516 RepID=A0A3P7RQ13_DIBLA|nr:unnamed protein product [Dibothriocephalus latus]
MPTDVRAVALSSQSIQVTWKRPNYTLPDEDGYKLEIVGEDFSDAVLVGTDVFSHTFSGLQPFTEYTIYVQLKDRIPEVLRPKGQISMSTWPAGKSLFVNSEFLLLKTMKHRTLSFASSECAQQLKKV